LCEQINVCICLVEIFFLIYLFIYFYILKSCFSFLSYFVSCDVDLFECAHWFTFPFFFLSSDVAVGLPLVSDVSMSFFLSLSFFFLLLRSQGSLSRLDQDGPDGESTLSKMDIVLSFTLEVRDSNLSHLCAFRRLYSLGSEAEHVLRIGDFCFDFLRFSLTASFFKIYLFYCCFL
jgi:hypothetical protein